MRRLAPELLRHRRNSALFSTNERDAIGAIVGTLARWPPCHGFPDRLRTTQPSGGTDGSRTSAGEVHGGCIVAANYGLSRDDFAWMLRDCDHPASQLSDKAFCRTLDPKGFWRIDKDQDPELRHTVLSLAAFDDLQRAIAAAGSRDAGIEAWCSQNDGDGWMLPETLCIADLGLTRTVALDYDDQAKTPQPVRNRMGERFLDWQLAQTPEESWAECERHAQAILQSMPAAPSKEQPSARTPSPRRRKPANQATLFGDDN